MPGVASEVAERRPSERTPRRTETPAQTFHLANLAAHGRGRFLLRQLAGSHSGERLGPVSGGTIERDACSSAHAMLAAKVYAGDELPYPELLAIREDSMSVYDLAVTDALLTTTRAVRKRLDLTRPVPEGVIRECLEISLQAPTGGNRQGWRWIVVTDAKKRRALAKLYRKGADTYLTDGYRQAEADGATQQMRVFDSARYLSEHMADVPVLVLPCIQVLSSTTTDPDVMWPSVLGSILPAMWSFQLALRARGLGSVYTTLHLNCAEEAANLLDIPDDIKQAGLLPVAYTLGIDFKPAKRRPLEEVLHWNGW